jgi:hypothetical protein
MKAAVSERPTQNRLAQLQYLASDDELCDLLWQIAALPEEARLIVRLMVAHLSAGKPASS